jgi:hypothetical protein
MAKAASLLRPSVSAEKSSVKDQISPFFNFSMLPHDEDSKPAQDTLLDKAQKLLMLQTHATPFSSPMYARASLQASSLDAPPGIETTAVEERLKNEHVKGALSGGDDDSPTPPSSGSSGLDSLSSGSAGISLRFDAMMEAPAPHWQAKAWLPSLAWMRDILTAAFTVLLTLSAGWSVPDILLSSLRWDFIRSRTRTYFQRLYA